jgi:hypothetical protein
LVEGAQVNSEFVIFRKKVPPFAFIALLGEGHEVVVPAKRRCSHRRILLTGLLGKSGAENPITA